MKIFENKKENEEKQEAKIGPQCEKKRFVSIKSEIQKQKTINRNRLGRDYQGGQDSQSTK